MLVVCCGLLAKWLRVRVRAGARDCTRCISFFSSCSVISVVNTFVFVGTVSARRGAHDGIHFVHRASYLRTTECARRVTYEYSIGDVTAT